MADALFKLQIITPERVFCEEEINRVTFTTTEGDIGVLKGHIPLTTTVKSGVVKIKTGEDEKRAALHGGFAEIKENEVTILADAAEWPEEIDVERAMKAKERAKEKIEHKSEVDMLRAEASLKRSLVRIEVAQKHK
ncbi:F-type H+-transporting ATPase subunit epsilon [Natranaerovirga hydrolytica]|uniref:ATP synthase epsilon chain n=1 Tax=Natranaerovirga hydrolytica TaxID=680378 RepID=A0A4R1MCZ5_9FIRM|nr:F0F1 ATP synthase subunit epsilon [Natranaerovirga hydrolytica]TCK87899.1 F-type H+-transporting ATPase subunit epsilon [Natranaerovirga hydrolytica]